MKSHCREKAAIARGSAETGLTPSSLLNSQHSDNSTSGYKMELAENRVSNLENTVVRSSIVHSSQNRRAT